MVWIALQRMTREAFSRLLLPAPLFAALALFALPAAPALALHITASGDGSICYTCHNLSTGASEPLTYAIWKNARTLSDMKTANGGTVPDQFGCTFCHSNEMNATMKGVLGHFTNKGSMHPVGWDFTAASNNNNGHEFTSTYNSATQNELDCVDCHDINLLDDSANSNYLDHVLRTGPLRANNTYMLRGGITAVGAYDNLCRLCHGNAAGPVKGPNDSSHNFQLTATAGHTDGLLVASGGSGYIVESDGTVLKPADQNGDGAPDAGLQNQCTRCHDSHYSNNSKLFNDGHESGEANLEVGSNCTGVCHYPGDATHLPDGNFGINGHGKATSFKGGAMGFGCSNCHSVNARHDSTFTDSRAAKMLLLQPDINLSTYGKSKNSICTICHGTYVAHKNGQNAVGCLDCHDEHAEGSGSTTNIYMIPQQLPNNAALSPYPAVRAAGSELTFFEHRGTPDYDYYPTVAGHPGPPDGPAGVCDNSICHAGQTAPDNVTPIAPLSGLMTGTRHSGGDIPAGTSCTICHKHNDTVDGSWGATGACDDCHGQPPISLATQNAAYDQHSEAKSPHARHSRVPPDGYGYGCQVCHTQFTNADTHDGANQIPPRPITYESIWFDQAYNPAAALWNPGSPTATPNYDKGTSTCGNLYCHSSGAKFDTVANGGSVGSQQWMTGFSSPDYAAVNLACDACHGDGNGDGVGRTYPADVNHARHLSPALVAQGLGCANCHFSTTNDGTTINVSGGAHVDRVKTVVSGGTFATFAVSFGWNTTSKTCSSLSCHSGESVAPFSAAPITWTDAGGSCTNCHNNGTNNDLLANAWPATGEHQIHAGIQPANYGYACTRCHPDNSGTHESLNKFISVLFVGTMGGGTFDNDGFNNVLGSPVEDADNNTCSATYCHGSDPTWLPDWDSTATSGDGVVRNAAGNTQSLVCDSCHGTAGLTTGRPNSPATGGRHAGANTVHEATACQSCHGYDTTTLPLPRASHAQGPAQVGPPGSWAGMAAAIDTATYVRGAVESVDQGFKFTNGTCGDMTTGCHPSARWGESLGCALCHGNRDYGPGLGRSSWPDGVAPAGHYYDNSAGAHNNHVDTIGQEIFGETAATGLLQNATIGNPLLSSEDKQKAICVYCHETAATVGGTNHRVDNGVRDPAGRVTMYLDTDDTTTRLDVFRKFTLGARADGQDLTAVNGDQAYSYANRSCANLVCHNQTLSPQGATNWDVPPAPTDCRVCHTDGAGTGAHARHTAAAQKNYACTQCHVSNGSFPVTAVPAEMRHVNGDVQMSFTVAGSLEQTRGGANGFYDKSDVAANNNVHDAGDDTFGYKDTFYAKDCLNMYCHGGEASQSTWTGSMVAPRWNTPADALCGTCHDNDAADTSPGTNFSINQHPTHQTAAYGPRTACGNCHGAALATTATHVNGSVSYNDAAQVLSGGIGADTTVTSCGGAALGCHAGSIATSKSEWAQAAGHWLNVTGGYCEHCHDATFSTVNTVAGTSGVNAVGPNKTLYYTAGGHGHTGVYIGTIGGGSGPGYACTVCHTTTSAHINNLVGDTDRMRTVSETPNLNYTGAISEVCLDCHKVGTITPTLGVPAATARATVHSGGVTGNYAASSGARPIGAPAAYPAYGQTGNFLVNPGYQCEACHDPHGTDRLAMILNTLDGRLGVGGLSNPIPVAGLQRGVATDLTDLDPSAAANNGVCDTCHLAGANPSHPDTAFSGNHNQGVTGAACMKCHSHEDSFRGNCARCHGNEVTGQIWPDAVPGNNSEQNAGNAYADDEIGGHTVHINALIAKEGFTTAYADQIVMCAYCHPNPGANGHDTNTASSPANQVDVIGDGFAAGTFKRIDGTSDKIGQNDRDVAGTYSLAAKTCSGVDCHYQAVSPAYAGAGWNAADSNVSTCTICHASTATYTNNALPNAHNKHVGTKGYACTQCHPNNSPDMVHQDGAVDLSFAATLGEPGTVPPNATVSDLAVKYGVLAGTYATCNGMYCHGDDTPFPAANGGIDTTPAWNLAATGACGTCHGVSAAVPPRSNTHVIHAGNTAQTPQGYSLGCNLCHYTVTTNGTTITTEANHVDLLAQVAFDGADNRLNTGSAPLSAYAPPGDTVVGSGFGACNNTYCHSPGNDRTKPFSVAPSAAVAWNQSGQPCTICHLVGPTYADGLLIDGVTPKANKHPEHVNQGYTLCSTCHVTTAASNSAISTFSAHVNFQYTVDPNTPGNGALNSFAYAAGSCATTNCHGGNTVAWSDPVGITCDVCHAEVGGVPTGVFDVNNFRMQDWTQSKINNVPGTGEYVLRGHGKTVPVLACSACHSSTPNHDNIGPFPNNLTGANPFRLRDNGGAGPGNFTCSDVTNGCHFTSPSRDVVDHTALNMQNSGYVTQVPWTFTPKCVDCHDPHGDGSNLKMITGDLIEGSANNWVPTVYPPENQALVFTDLTGGSTAAGTSWAQSGAPFSSLCQECHETANANMTAFKDGSAANVSPWNMY